MRQIILDTETTGLDPKLGHRVIEIAAVEIVDRRLTGNHFHRYVNPGRASEDGALQVHGLTEDFLRDKPKFGDIAKEFIEFVAGAELIIHNAAFDCAFLDSELALLDLTCIGEHCPQVLDTLRMARDLHPGKKNNLNSLCERYQIDNSARTLHGAVAGEYLPGFTSMIRRDPVGVVASIGRMRQSLKIDIDQRRVQSVAVVKLLKHIEDFLGWTAGKAGHMSRATLCLDDSLDFLAK